jgi:hypothetical protein
MLGWLVNDARQTSRSLLLELRHETPDLGTRNRTDERRENQCPAKAGLWVK